MIINFKIWKPSKLPVPLTALVKKNLSRVVNKFNQLFWPALLWRKLSKKFNLQYRLKYRKRWHKLWHFIIQTSHKLSCKTMTSSQVKIKCYFHMRKDPHCQGNIINHIFWYKILILYFIGVDMIIVHSTKLLNFDWSRAVQLIPNCTPQEYLLIFHGNEMYAQS